jgi:hypothetical protein
VPADERESSRELDPVFAALTATAEECERIRADAAHEAARRRARAQQQAAAIADRAAEQAPAVRMQELAKVAMLEQDAGAERASDEAIAHVRQEVQRRLPGVVAALSAEVAAHLAVLAAGVAADARAPTWSER